MEENKLNWQRGIIWTLAAALFFISASIYRSYDKPVDQLQIFFFDVGQGDSALIQKGEQQTLIDGGPDDQVLAELGKVMPVWDRKIETIILSHPHADHLTGLNLVLDRYEVGKIYSTGVVYSTNQYLEFLEKIKSKSINYSVPAIGEKINLLDGKIEFLWPGEKYQKETPDNLNNSSIVFNFCQISSCVLFTGDQENDEQEAMLNYFEQKDELDKFKAEIIKVSHHGSRNGSSRKLYEIVIPKYAVISVGEGNSFGHPHQGTLDLLNEFGIKTLRMDQDDSVQFVFNSETDNFRLEK